MGGHKIVALRETDQAVLARGVRAVRRLDILALRFCYRNPDDEAICEMREATQDLLFALTVARLVVSRVYKER